MASKSSVVRTAATNFVNATLNAYKAEVDAVYAKKAGLLSRAQADLLYMPISYASAAPVVTVPGNANDNWLSVNPDGTYDIDITRNITNAVYALAWVGAPYNTTPVEILPDENSDFRFQFNGVIQQGVADTKFDVHVTLFSPDGLITHYKFESGNVNATDYAPKIPAGQDVSIPISISYTSANGTSHFDSLRAVFTTPSISAVTNATTVSYLVEAMDVYGNKLQSSNIVALSTSDFEAVLDTSSVQAFQRRVAFSVRVKATYSNFFGSVSVENSVPTSNAYTEIAQTAVLLFTSTNLAISSSTSAVTAAVNGDLIQATIPMYQPVPNTTLTLTQSNDSAFVSSGPSELYTGVEYTCMIPVSYDWVLGQTSQAGFTGAMSAMSTDGQYKTFKFTAGVAGVYALQPIPSSGSGTSSVKALNIPVCTRPKYQLQNGTSVSGTLYFKKDQTTSVSTPITSVSIKTENSSYIVKMRPTVTSLDFTEIKNSIASVAASITAVNDKGVQSTIDQSAVSMSSLTIPDLTVATDTWSFVVKELSKGANLEFTELSWNKTPALSDSMLTMTSTPSYHNGNLSYSVGKQALFNGDLTEISGTVRWFSTQYAVNTKLFTLQTPASTGSVTFTISYHRQKYRPGLFILKNGVQVYADSALPAGTETSPFTFSYTTSTASAPPQSTPSTPTPVNGQFAFGTTTAGVDSIALTGLQYSGGDSYVYVQPTTPTKLTYAQAITDAVQISGNQYTIAGLASGVQYDVYGLSSGSGGGTTACITTTVTTVSPTVSFDQVDVAFDYYGATGTGAYTNKPTATVKFSTVPTTSPVPYVYMTVKAVPSTTTYTDLASTTPVIGGTSVSYSFPNLEYGTTYTVYACAKRVDSSTTNGADTSVISKQFTTPASEVLLPGTVQTDPTHFKKVQLILAAADVPQRLKVVIDTTIRAYSSIYGYAARNHVRETGADSRLGQCGVYVTGGTSGANLYFYPGWGQYSDTVTNTMLNKLTGRHTLVSYYDFISKTYEFKLYDVTNTLIFYYQGNITGNPQPGKFPVICDAHNGDENDPLVNNLLHSIKAYKVSGP